MVLGTVTGADAEETRLFFLDADIDIGFRFIRPFFRLKVYFLKIA